MQRVQTTAALALLFATMACKSEDGPDSFVRSAVKAAEGEPQALWTALPESYQKDVQGLLQSFAGGMNEQLWNDGFKIAQKTVKVLETKRELILGHPRLKGVLTDDEVAKGWDPAVRVLSALVNSDIKSLEGVKKLDVEKFLGGPVASMLEDAMKTAELAAAKMPGPDAKELTSFRSKLKTAKISVEKKDGDTATVKIEVEGEEPELQEMVRVEGKWIPKELADQWPGAIAQAKLAVAALKIGPETVVQFNMMKGMIDPVLDGLLQAKTQEEFDAQIAAVMKALGGRGAGMDQPADDPGLEEAQEAPAEPKKKKRSRKKRRER